VETVDTTRVVIERRGDLLVIVPPSERGGTGTTIGADPRRRLHAFGVPHPEVREIYKGWSQAKILRESYIGPNRSTSGPRKCAQINPQTIATESFARN